MNLRKCCKDLYQSSLDIGYGTLRCIQEIDHETLQNSLHKVVSGVSKLGQRFVHDNEGKPIGISTITKEGRPVTFIDKIKMHKNLETQDLKLKNKILQNKLDETNRLRFHRAAAVGSAGAAAGIAGSHVYQKRQQNQW